MHAHYKEPCYVVPCTCGSKCRHSIGMIPLVPHDIGMIPLSTRKLPMRAALQRRRQSDTEEGNTECQSHCYQAAQNFAKPLAARLWRSP